MRVFVAILAALMLCCSGASDTDLVPISEEVDVVLVGTVDGFLHAFSAEDGETLWKFHTGAPLLSSSSHSSVERLIPSIDGTIFLLDQGKLQRAGLDIQELVQRAPSVTREHAWTGSKKARMYVINLISGEVEKELSSFVPEEEQRQRGKNSILIGRADFVVRGMDRHNENAQLWNMSFAKYVADDVLDADDDTYPFRFEGENFLVSAKRKGTAQTLWKQRMESQPVSFYRIRRDADGWLSVAELTRKPTEGLIGHEGVLVERFGNQLFAIPETSFVAPRERAEGTALLDPEKLSGHYVVDKAAAGVKLLLGAGEEREEEEEEEDFLSEIEGTLGWSFALYLLFSGALTSAVVFVLVLFRRMERRRKQQSKARKKKSANNSNNKALAREKKNSMKITVSEDVLGYGSCGTVVFKGQLEGREVAVKRMLKEFYEVAEKETDILLKGDSHPNVVRYYLKEEDDKFVYLALSYCVLTLADVFENNINNNNNNNNNNNMGIVADEFVLAKQKARDNPARLIHDLVNGLKHLHCMGIVHRDLKPQNILIDVEGRIQISDMGLAKKLDHRNHSFSTVNSGTLGYQAPEILLGKRQTIKLDIWGFGCLMYFVLSKGHHPFGDRTTRESNILRSSSNLSHVKDVLALNLVQSCINAEPELRPSMDEIEAHPFFWDAHKRLHFLLDVSDLLESLEGNIEATLEFEKMQVKVVGKHKEWKDVINPRLFDNIGRYRKYSNSVKDLLRVIRNKSHHFRDLEGDLQAMLGPHPEGYLNYFASLFPQLFVQCYKFIKGSKRGYKFQPSFQRYFTESN